MSGESPMSTLDRARLRSALHGGEVVAFGPRQDRRAEAHGRRTTPAPGRESARRINQAAVPGPGHV